jgi:hypothetical protein
MRGASRLAEDLLVSQEGLSRWQRLMNAVVNFWIL